MQLIKFSTCGLSLIALVCSLGVNDAIPFGPYAEGKVRSSASRQPKAWETTEKVTRVTGHPEALGQVVTDPKLVTDSPIKSLVTRRTNFNINSNVNENEILIGIIRPEVKKPKSQRKESMENAISDNSNSLTDSDDEPSINDSNGLDLESDVNKIVENPRMPKEVHEKCASDGLKGNKVYSRSFPLKSSSFDFADAFKVAGETEAKKTSSVHVGNDITLCWIETTTIKEDPTFDPPKRLVIREYTISLENSATIPESYLECTKLDGEIPPGDTETICKTSLREVINVSTKRSRLTNFTSDSHIGPILVYQQKTVRCAVGGVVFKDIYEWPDGSGNPSKRVEIKVGPSIGNIEKCTTDGVAEVSEKNSDSSPVPECTSGESCETSLPCKEGKECNQSSTISPCEGENCATTSASETLSGTYPSESDELKSTGITRITTTKRPNKSATPTKLSTLFSLKRTQPVTHSCPEYDKDCESSTTAMEPGESCSDEDCFGESFDESASATTDDDSNDTSSLCTGDDCVSKDTSATAESDGTAGLGSESCQEGSESCGCSGSSCSVHSSLESGTLPTGDKLIDGTTVPSLSVTNEMTFNDSGCDSESAECSGSSETYSHEEGTTTRATLAENDSKSGEHVIKNDEKTALNDSNVESGKTEFPDTIGSTEFPELNEPSPTTETLPACRGSESVNCSTVVPTSAGLPDELTTGTQDYSSSTARTILNVTTKEDLESSETHSGDRTSSSCDGDSSNENCQSTESSSESEFEKDYVTSDVFNSQASISPISEEQEKHTNPVDDAVTATSTIGTHSEITIAQTSTERSIENVTSGNAETSSGQDSRLQCSSNSEGGSGDCGEGQIDVPSGGSDETTVSPESCGSLGSCDTMEENSTETNQSTFINSIEIIDNLDETSCDDSKESCETSVALGSSSETCEDGSSSDGCTRNGTTPESCDSSSGSCSSEASNSSELIDETTITTTQSTVKELKDLSTTIDNVSTTGEVRPNTTTALPLVSAPTKRRHKLALRIKVLVEHINENKEKEKLVQLEKHLLLNESPDEHGNHSLIWQIKSLNKSMNMETFKSIFNCTALENLTEHFSNLTEFEYKSEEKISLPKKAEDTSVEKLTSEPDDENEDNSRGGSNESLSRRKRDILMNKTTGEKDKNVADLTKQKAIRESLPGVKEDFQKGLDHVIGRISQELEDPAVSTVTKPAESSSSKILKILANPTDGRIHSKRRKRASEVGRMVAVEESKYRVNGEEIDGWSNERFVNAANGGRVRSLLEFKIMRDPGEGSRRIPSGS